MMTSIIRKQRYASIRAVALCRNYCSVQQQQQQQQPKTGILMMNLGGPSSTGDVHDFLHRLFTDVDLIQLPMQSISGPLIARRRTPSIREQYEKIGGGSPIRHWTELQGKLMSIALDSCSPSTGPHKAYTAFRYAHPLTEEALSSMAADGVQRVVAFTQYPQYSCSTTGSSLSELRKQYERMRSNGDISRPMAFSVIDRWPTHVGLVAQFAHHIEKELASFPEDERDDVYLLFSAHSLPMRSVNRGDPYPYEVAATVRGVIEQMKMSHAHSLVWQSKVGPAAWLGPQTNDALNGLLKRGKKNIIIVPIAFTSDHIETLYELDHEYIKEAVEKGMNVRRVKSLNAEMGFINTLADIVTSHLASDEQCSKQMLECCPMCTKDTCSDTKTFFSSRKHALEI